MRPWPWPGEHVYFMIAFLLFMIIYDPSATQYILSDDVDARIDSNGVRMNNNDETLNMECKFYSAINRKK